MLGRKLMKTLVVQKRLAFRRERWHSRPVLLAELRNWSGKSGQHREEELSYRYRFIPAEDHIESQLISGGRSRKRRYPLTAR